jgi:hypothetical protein
MNRRLATLALAATTALTLTACSQTQADRASYNVSQEADNFRIDRRLAVINTITDTPIIEMTGKFSIREDGDQLEVTMQDDNGDFKKHFIGLPPTVAYVVEDVTGTNVSGTRYQISYLPESIIPVEFVNGTN